ncbi:MAG TPA: hypothetical protein VF800_17950 [Telluria sp.]
MWLLRLSSLALLAIALPACTSGYESRTANLFRGVQGGYEEAPGPGKLIKVSYTGSLGVGVHIAAHYVLYRSAEIAQREGKPYFALYQDLPSALKDRRSPKATFSTVDGMAFSYAYILPLDANEEGLLSATAVMRQLELKVKGAPP